MPQPGGRQDWCQLPKHSFANPEWKLSLQYIGMIAKVLQSLSWKQKMSLFLWGGIPVGSVQKTSYKNPGCASSLHWLLPVQHALKSQLCISLCIRQRSGSVSVKFFFHSNSQIFFRKEIEVLKKRQRNTVNVALTWTVKIMLESSCGNEKAPGTAPAIVLME